MKRELKVYDLIYQYLILKHTIEYLTNNGELDTSDGQRLLTTSLEKLAKSNLSDLKDCDCRKD